MEEMELNNLTKALKGRLFHTHCKTLMGLRGLMNTYLTRSIKIKTCVIVSIISPIHNIYIYIYKCAGVCWNSNSYTLDSLWTSSAQQMCLQPFEFHSHSHSL